ncbi:MAG: response regulator [Nitrospirota bacterium]
MPPHKILVVDDEEKVSKSLSGLLQDQGYDVIIAGSGSECLQIMSSQNFDLVILDIVIPGRGGVEVLQKIKEKYRDTEVIIITGYADKEKAIATFRLGAYDFIEKPFESSEILNTISHCLNQLELRREIERKNRELKESGERYRLLAENVADVIWTLDIKSLKTTYVSPSVTRLRGYSVEEVMAQTLEEILTPSSLNVALKTFEEEMAIEKMEHKDMFRTRTLELESKCKDGSTVWTEAKMTFMRDPDGRPIEVLGVSRDITKRREVEQALRRLSPREKEILQFVVEGKTSTDIAEILSLSPKTVETYRSRLMAKLAIRNLPDLIKFAIRMD